MHIIDPIERGLLRVGTKAKYNKILKRHNFTMLNFIYSGIIIGPDSKILNLISYILNKKIFFTIFGWLNPKLVFVAEKNNNLKSN